MRKRIGDVARSAGVGVETVRFYERLGLIDQPVKPHKGWREYGDASIQQLEYIRLAREMGLTLRDVKRLKDSPFQGRKSFCANVRETVTARLHAVEAKLAELERERANLSGWLVQCAARNASDRCPLYQQVREIHKKSTSKT